MLQFWTDVCLKAVATGVVDGCFSDSSQPETHGTAKHLNASYNTEFEAGKVLTMSGLTSHFNGSPGKPYTGSTGTLLWNNIVRGSVMELS